MSESLSPIAPAPAPRRNFVAPHKREYLVDLRFQAKYAIVLGLSAVLGTGFGGMIIMLAFENAVQGGPLEIAWTTEQQMSMLVLMFFAAVMAGLTMACVGIIITQRVAGPMRALSQMIAAFGEDMSAPKRRLRSGDEFVTYFEEIREVLTSIADQRAREQALMQQAAAVLRSGGATSEAVAALSQALEGHEPVSRPAESLTEQAG